MPLMTETCTNWNNETKCEKIKKKQIRAYAHVEIN